MLGVFRGGLRWPRKVWLVVLGVTLVMYFGYHGLTGSRGLLAWRDVNAQLKSTRQELDLLRAERTGLAKKVERLRDDSLDTDLIDELARRRLSLADPLDVIILLDDEARGR
jgi:cell division protein FtsB